MTSHFRGSRHTTAELAAAEGFVLTLKEPAPPSRPKRHTCRGRSCQNPVAPYRLLCDACWHASPLELRKAFLATKAGTPERTAAAEALLGGVASSSVQPLLPGVPVRRRSDRLSAEEMAVQASRFIGPPTADERRRDASWAACDAFNAAHPLGSSVQVPHGGRLVTAFVHGAAAAAPPSWRSIVVVRLGAEPRAPTLQLPLESIKGAP